MQRHVNAMKKNEARGFINVEYIKPRGKTCIIENQ
jgi:hypothetical protein